MPKHGHFYNTQITFSCEADLHEKLLALGYLRGYAGSYAPIARVLLRRVVEDEVAQLDPQEEKDFKKILENIRTKKLMTRMKRQDIGKDAMRD